MEYTEDLHVDFNAPISERVLRSLNMQMWALDVDWVTSGVYSTGIRMRWHSPLVNLETLIEIFKSLGISGKGWFLPSGTNCDKGIDHCCGNQPSHTIGRSLCQAVPKSEDWFTF
jgi:hypothetical protein